MKTNRDIAIDITKGLLISLLVLHHIIDFGVREYGIKNELLSFGTLVQRPLALCFFMQTFFLITGMCSNFNTDVRTFFFKQVRTLLMPAFAFAFAFHLFAYGFHAVGSFCKGWLLYGGCFWFITSLFFAKVLYYLVLRVVQDRWTLLGLGLLLSMAGTILNEYDVATNIYTHRQTLDLFVYLVIGNAFKETITKWSKKNWPLVVYVICVLLGLMALGYKLPYVTYGFGTTVMNWPLHMALAFFGSLSIIRIARMLVKWEWLGFVGKMSMIVYFIQGEMLLLLMALFRTYLESANLRQSILAVSIIFLSVMSASLVVGYLLNNSPMAILLGKKNKNVRRA